MPRPGYKVRSRQLAESVRLLPWRACTHLSRHMSDKTQVVDLVVHPRPHFGSCCSKKTSPMADYRLLLSLAVVGCFMPAEASMRDLVKTSALHEAAYTNDCSALRDLLKNSAGGACWREACVNVNARISSSDTALHMAVSRDHQEAVEVGFIPGPGTLQLANDANMIRWHS